MSNVEQKQISWFDYYMLCKDYYNTFGNLNIPYKYKVKSVNLGFWLYRQRKKYKEKKLDKDSIIKLEKLNIVWDFFEDTWGTMYQYAKEYYKINGDLLIPTHYIVDNKDLGGWISTQRKGYYHLGRHALSEERKKMLEEINMIWDVKLANWLKYYQEARKFYDKFNHLYIPVKYKVNDLCLGKWLSVQRYNYRKAIKENTLSMMQEKVELLENIGMDWSINKQKNTSFGEQILYYYLSQCFSDIENRYNELGFEIDVYIPSLKLGIEYDGYIGHTNKEKDIKKIEKCQENGVVLLNIRENRCPMLEKGNICIIDSTIEGYEKGLLYILAYINNNFGLELCLDINIARDSQDIMDMYLMVINYNWEKYYEEAKKYYKNNGNLLIPCRYSVNGLNLGYWIRRQRQGYKLKYGNRLNRIQIERLEDIGMVWDVKESFWDSNFKLIEKVIKETKLNITSDLKYEGVKIGYWWYEQQKKLEKNLLSKDKENRVRGLNKCLKS